MYFCQGRGCLCHIIPETFPTTASTAANTPESMCVPVFLFRPLCFCPLLLLLCLAIHSTSACHIPHQHMVSHSILSGIYKRYIYPSSAFWKRAHMHTYIGRVLRFDGNSFGVKINMEPAVMPHLFDFPPTCCYTPILKSVCGTDFCANLIRSMYNSRGQSERHAQRQPVMSKSKDFHTFPLDGVLSRTG